MKSSSGSVLPCGPLPSRVLLLSKKTERPPEGHSLDRESKEKMEDKCLFAFFDLSFIQDYLSDLLSHHIPPSPFVSDLLPLCCASFPHVPPPPSHVSCLLAPQQHLSSSFNHKHMPRVSPGLQVRLKHENIVKT